MTIHLPQTLENPILAAVHSGRYASLDDAMTDAAAMLVERLQREHAQAKRPSANQPEGAEKPIWEDILEMTADVPDEEWAKLPPDLAEQHDHSIYGLPKRPTA